MLLEAQARPLGAHAGGDATGAEIQRALIEAVGRAPEIEIIKRALAVDLLLDGPAGEGGAGVLSAVSGYWVENKKPKQCLCIMYFLCMWYVHAL